MSGKVLLYTHALVGGGGERLWASLASVLAAQGYDVIFAEDHVANENRGLLSSAVRVVTLGGGHLASTRALAHLLKRERPDVALSAIGASNLKLIAANMMAGRRTPVVISYHGFDDWKSGKLSFLTYALLPILSRLADKVVAVSDGLAEVITSRWRARADRVVSLHNPVFFPDNIHVPAPEALAARSNQILAVGRLVPEKDYPTLLTALSRLKTKDATLLILGAGPLESELRNLAKSLDVQSRVTFAGYATSPWHAYADAKCFVLSSRKEAFGNIIVEALAHGLPVVATRTVGADYILDGGTYGRLVAISDVDALAAAIDATLADPCANAQRVTRAATFSMAARVPANIALIESVKRRI